MVKDYYVLRRDLRNLSQLITPLIFGVIYTFILLREPQSIYGRNEMPEFIAAAVKNLSLYINVGMSLFVSWMLVARLGGMAFAQEGKSFWMLKTAPLRVSQLVLAKFAAAFLPGLLLGWVFLVALAILQQAALSVLWFTAPAVALIIAGNTGLQLTFGITGANMDWSDPRQMMRSSAGCLSSIVSAWSIWRWYSACFSCRRWARRCSASPNGSGRWSGCCWAARSAWPAPSCR